LQKEVPAIAFVVHVPPDGAGRWHNPSVLDQFVLARERPTSADAAAAFFAAIFEPIALPGAFIPPPVAAAAAAAAFFAAIFAPRELRVEVPPTESPLSELVAASSGLFGVAKR
jgi:hypothetical protein